MNNIKEAIRAEIERRIANKIGNEHANPILRAELRGLLSFIDSLPEEKPSKDLEYTAHLIAIETLNDTKFMTTTMGYVLSKLQDIFIAGAQWQREQMLKEAVECEVGSHGEPIQITLDKYTLLYKDIFPGDRVKIIIAKKEE